MAVARVQNRPLSEVAKEIKKDWIKPYFGAVPYIQAMSLMDKASDSYGWDSGESIVLYFLSNATTWRGSKAKEIKLELKAMVGLK